MKPMGIGRSLMPIVLALATVLPVFHAHDHADADDCPVCHAQLTAGGVLPGEANISESNVVSTRIDESLLWVPSLARACFQQRGPPPTS